MKKIDLVLLFLAILGICIIVGALLYEIYMASNFYFKIKG